MKVLQVNCVYKDGSTGKITYDIHNELQKNGIGSIVCYGRGKHRKEAGVYKICGEIYAKANNLLSRFTGIMYGGCHASTQYLIKIIEKENPDIVHLQCINGYFVNIYRLLNWLKEKQIKTVLTLHAEFMYTGNCGHALDCGNWLTGCGNCPRLRAETKSLLFDNTHKAHGYMKKAFEGFEENLTVVSVSPWLRERAENSPVLSGKHHAVIFNGIDTQVFFPRNCAELKRKHGLQNKKVIFHVTACFREEKEHLKGGYYVLELAKRLADMPVRIFVAGEHGLTGSLPDNVIMLGKIEDQKELAQYYSMADVTLLTSKKETFSMPCVESLCCGTPVVGFEAGAPEQISLRQYSAFVPYGDLDGLERQVKLCLSVPDNRREAMAQEAGRAYSKQKMADKYIDVYRGMLK